LRSSLDQLIWELIKRNGNDPLSFKRPKPEFPIYNDRNKYEADGAGKIQGISQWAQAKVLDSQPFPNTHNWPLWSVL
jgi:hypothetical protein